MLLHASAVQAHTCDRSVHAGCDAVLCGPASVRNRSSERTLWRITERHLGDRLRLPGRRHSGATRRPRAQADRTPALLCAASTGPPKWRVVLYRGLAACAPRAIIGICRTGLGSRGSVACGSPNLSSLLTGRARDSRVVPAFSVVVPFEPVLHETLDSRVFTNIPDTDLAAGIQIRRSESGYLAELQVDADRPGTAKAIAVDRVERLLAVLASWNHGFQVRIGGVRSEMFESGGSGTAAEVSPGVVAVTASETLFLEEHLEAVVSKANLDAEDAFLQRYDGLPEYIRSCLELNYLLVLSTRLPNRWLLAATGLEALAVGTIGAQDTVTGRLDADQRRALMRAVRAAVEAVGLPEMRDRILGRVLGTTTGPVANHVHRYLAKLGIHHASPDDINRWWRTRGTLAHGGAVDIDLGDLNHLINVFQVALRRTARAEAIPPPPPAATPPDPPHGQPAAPHASPASGGLPGPPGSERRSPPPVGAGPAVPRTRRRWRDLRWRPKWSGS